MLFMEGDKPGGGFESIGDGGPPIVDVPSIAIGSAALVPVEANEATPISAPPPEVRALQSPARDSQAAGPDAETLHAPFDVAAETMVTAGSSGGDYGNPVTHVSTSHEPGDSAGDTGPENNWTDDEPASPPVSGDDDTGRIPPTSPPHGAGPADESDGWDKEGAEAGSGDGGEDPEIESFPLDGEQELRDFVARLQRFADVTDAEDSRVRALNNGDHSPVLADKVGSRDLIKHEVTVSADPAEAGKLEGRWVACAPKELLDMEPAEATDGQVVAFQAGGLHEAIGGTDDGVVLTAVNDQTGQGFVAVVPRKALKDGQDMAGMLIAAALQAVPSLAPLRGEAPSADGDTTTPRVTRAYIAALKANGAQTIETEIALMGQVAEAAEQALGVDPTVCIPMFRDELGLGRMERLEVRVNMTNGTLEFAWRDRYGAITSQYSRLQGGTQGTRWGYHE